MKTVNLPYVDNAKAIALTTAINLGVVFLFNWPDGVAYSGVMWDSLICAFVTVAIDMWIVYAGLKKMSARGEMPSQVPESGFMQRLPQNPFTLGAIYAVVFAALTIGVNSVILSFFDLRSMTFAAWAVYKVVYATALSVEIVEFCIFRYVQPDWARTGSTDAETTKATNSVAVKNPLTKISIFKEMVSGVIGNIVMNIIMGSALGGVKVQTDGSVVISPTTVEGIPITGLLFGLIVGILVTNAIVKEMRAVILSSGPAMLEAAAVDKRFSWMPKGKALTCFVTICVMIFSAVALRLILTLFEKPLLDFYQFTIFITVYAALVSKPLSYALTRRCLQPDYIRYTLKKGDITK
jgi:hypothetical protein